MILNLDSSHPFFAISDFLLRKFGEKQSSNLFLEMSRYIYIPDSLSDERETFSISLNNFTHDYVLQKINSLSSNQELAFHSRVKVNNRNYHIGLIDFFIPEKEFIFEKHYIRLKQILPTKITQNLLLYSSGNSLHGYSLVLLEPKEWRQFMSRLLLINQPYMDYSLIDTRWVGHRLYSEFGSLRWSNNSGIYKSLPKLISNI